MPVRDVGELTGRTSSSEKSVSVEDEREGGERRRRPHLFRERGSNERIVGNEKNVSFDLSDEMV